MESLVFRAFVDELLKLARGDQSRWDEVIIDTPNARLTKRDVFNYYREPRIQKAILDQVKGRETIVRQSFTPEFVVLKRKEGGKPIRIEQAGKDVNDPKDLHYFVERRMTEFHPVLRRMEDKLILDLDPQPDFPFEDVKSYAAEVAAAMKRLPSVQSTEIRYSGGRGFYVIGNLRQPIDVDEGRKLMKKVVAPILDMDERLTTGVAKGTDQMRLDLGTFKEKGSIRGLWSLNASTGLVSVPVTDLARFDPARHATIEAVLGRKPREFKHAR